MNGMRGRSPELLSKRLADTRLSLVSSLEALRLVVDRISVTLLRVSIGVVFVWFGALKLTGSTPVGELVANTVPILPAALFVPALGVFEVILGVALLVGRRVELIAIVLVLHLTGTFLVLVTQPRTAFLDGNPLMLTMIGEFVVKNVVLIAAGLVVATKCQPQDAAARAPLADASPTMTRE